MAKARSLFVTALARQCPDKVAGLGTGYLGELDAKPYDSLLAKVRSLAAQRGELVHRSALVERLRLAGVAFLWYRVYEPNGA